MKNLSYILAATALGSSSVASANAFNINEYDALVTGRGDATVASNTTPSALAYNPAGIAVGEGANFQIGTSLIWANGSYEPAGGGDRVSTDVPVAVVPNTHITYRLNDLLAVGVGVHVPFGLSISWPQHHPQSDLVQDEALKTYFITPQVGINLDRWVPGLSIGGGPDIVPATVELRQDILFGDTQGTAHLGAHDVGFGARAGVMYRPPEAKLVKVGAMWRSEVKLDFVGTGDFDMPAPFRAELPPDGHVSTTVKLPQSFSGGVALDPIPNLEVELDAVWMDWSKFNEIRIQFPDGTQSVEPQNYHDTWTWRLGAEYAIPKYTAAVRAGFIYDPTPIPSETLTARLPDTNRKNLTLGASKSFGADYAMHLGLLWVTPADRETSSTLYMPIYKGTYKVEAFVAALTVSGHLGK